MPKKHGLNWCHEMTEVPCTSCCTILLVKCLYPHYLGQYAQRGGACIRKYYICFEQIYILLYTAVYITLCIVYSKCTWCVNCCVQGSAERWDHRVHQNHGHGRSCVGVFHVTCVFFHVFTALCVWQLDEKKRYKRSRFANKNTGYTPYLICRWRNYHQNSCEIRQGTKVGETCGKLMALSTVGRHQGCGAKRAKKTCTLLKTNIARENRPSQQFSVANCSFQGVPITYPPPLLRYEHQATYNDFVVVVVVFLLKAHQCFSLCQHRYGNSGPVGMVLLGITGYAAANVGTFGELTRPQAT